MAWEDRGEVLRNPTNWESYGEPIMEVLRSLIPGGVSYNKQRSGGQVTDAEVAQDMANLATLGAGGAIRGVSDVGRNLLNQRALAKKIPELGERLYSMGTPLSNVPKAIARQVGGWGQKAWESIPVLESLQPATVQAERSIPEPLQKLTRNWTNNWLGRLGVTVPYVEDPEKYPVTLIPRNKAAQRDVYEAIFGKKLPLNANAYLDTYAPKDRWMADVVSVARDAPNPAQSAKHEIGHLASKRVRGYHSDYTNTPEVRMAEDKARFVQPISPDIPPDEVNAMQRIAGHRVDSAIQQLPQEFPRHAAFLEKHTGYRGPQVGEEIWTRSQALDKAGMPQMGGALGLLDDPFWKTLADVRKSYTHPSWYTQRPDLPGPPALLSYAEQFLTNQPGQWDTLRSKVQDYARRYGDYNVNMFNLDQ